ncbi:MAG: nucleotidyltransferase [Clostridiales bacterium]|nr:nucleotidyltransferase [Clostridiales bacterium]
MKECCKRCECETKKPALVIMAAGMGSRYGGLKQLDPFDDYGNFIIDYSCFDAIRAGFDHIVFIIKSAIYEDFVSTIGARVSKFAKVDYVLQELDKLPEGFTVPEGRVKPWGTSHAILCAAEVVDGPFAVIGADDYFGPSGFKIIYDFLMTHPGEGEWGMIGYDVMNTIPDHGLVARGECAVDENGFLTDIVERKKLQKTADLQNAEYTLDGENFIPMKAGTCVSMNFFGFKPSLFEEIRKHFPVFLEENIPLDPMKCEDLLPDAVRRCLKTGKYTVKVLATPDKWYGVTNREDKPVVVAALRKFTEEGLYPEGLWK